MNVTLTDENNPTYELSNQFSDDNVVALVELVGPRVLVHFQ